MALHLVDAGLDALQAKDKEAAKVNGDPVEEKQKEARGGMLQVLGRVLCLVNVRELHDQPERKLQAGVDNGR